MAFNDDIRTEIELLGLPELVDKLNELSNLAREREVGDGLKNSAQYLIGRGKLRLRQRMKSSPNGVTGNLMRSFRFHIKRGNRGVLVGFKYGKNGGNHAHLVSEGTQDRYTKKGYFRGKVLRRQGDGNKFWSDTRKQDGNKALKITMDSIQHSINKLKNR